VPLVVAVEGGGGVRHGRARLKQGCQMVYFQTKNPILGKIWRVLGMENVVIGIL
jgi:hypothetical protein